MTEPHFAALIAHFPDADPKAVTMIAGLISLAGHRPTPEAVRAYARRRPPFQAFAGIVTDRPDRPA